MYYQIKGWRSECFVALNTLDLSLVIRIGEGAIASFSGAMTYLNQ